MKTKTNNTAQKLRIISINKSLSSCKRQAKKLIVLTPKEQLNIIKELEKKMDVLSQMLKMAKLVAENGEDHEKLVSC